MARLHVEL